jgi:flagellar biosynthesis protein FliR
MLINIASDEIIKDVIAGAIIFSRIAGCIMILPAIGEVYVSARIRLLLALMLSILLLPIMVKEIHVQSSDFLKIISLMMCETFIGIIMGLVAKLIISVIHTVGFMISAQSGLSAAMQFDPHQGVQSTIEGNLLSLLTICLFFALDMHVLIISGLLDSYNIFQLGVWPKSEDTAKMSIELVNQGFFVAFKIASPNIAVGMVLFFASGIISRLMPAMQVFFILLPAQIILSFAVLLITISISMMWYMQYFQDKFLNILGL